MQSVLRELTRKRNLAAARSNLLNWVDRALHPRREAERAAEAKRVAEAEKRAAEAAKRAAEAAKRAALLERRPRSPNFMIAGEQKAGTSYLWRNLRTHPQIFLTRLKEPLFFSSTEFDPSQAYGYLRRHFNIGGTRSLIGEASASYFHDEFAAQRMKDALGGDLRFIICMRQPVEKAVSLYMHGHRRQTLRGDESLEYLENSRFRLLQATQHAEASERFISLFGRERLHFLLFDTLRQSPIDFVNSALEFLSAKPLTEVIERPLNKGYDLRWEDDHLVLPKDNPIDRDQVHPRLPRDDLLRFHNQSLEDIARTEDIIGIDLSAWRTFPEATLGAAD